MIVIEASRRASRAAVNRVRSAFIEFDRVAFKDVDIPAEEAYVVIRQGRTFVLAVDDPSLEGEAVD